MTKTGKANKAIKPGDIVYISVDGLEGDGFPLNTRALVASTMPLPIDKKDVYLQRIYVLINKLDTEARTMDDQLCVIDPRSLKRVGNKERLEVYDWLNKEEDGVH